MPIWRITQLDPVVQICVKVLVFVRTMNLNWTRTCNSIKFWTPRRNSPFVHKIRTWSSTPLVDNFFNYLGSITVFVPSNQAFEDIPKEEKDNLQDLSYVKFILLSHIVHGVHEKRSFRNEVQYNSESRQEAQSELLKVRMNVYHRGEVRKTFTNGSNRVNTGAKRNVKNSKSLDYR